MDTSGARDYFVDLQARVVARLEEAAFEADLGL